MRWYRQARQKPESEIRIAIFFIFHTFLRPRHPCQRKGQLDKKKRNRKDEPRTKHRVRTNDAKVCLRCSAAYSIFTFPVSTGLSGLRSRQVTGLSVLCTFILFSLSDLFYFIFIVGIGCAVGAHCRHRRPMPTGNEWTTECACSLRMLIEFISQVILLMQIPQRFITDVVYVSCKFSSFINSMNNIL